MSILGWKKGVNGIKCKKSVQKLNYSYFPLFLFIGISMLFYIFINFHFLHKEERNFHAK